MVWLMKHVYHTVDEVLSVTDVVSLMADDSAIVEISSLSLVVSIQAT